MVALVLSATEGVGLLLLIPLLQLVGVGNAQQGALSEGVAMLGTAFSAAGAGRENASPSINPLSHSPRPLLGWKHAKVAELADAPDLGSGT